MIAFILGMNKQVLLTYVSIIVMNLFCCDFSFARVDLTKTRKLNLPESKEAEFLYKDFTDRILPKDVQKGESANVVLSKMADNTVAYWWDTTPLRQSALGRAADNIEKKARLKGEIQDANQVTHFFDLKVLVMQALARFEYRGWFHAGINYDARAVATEAEIVQPLTKDKDLVVSQQFNQTESTSRLSLKFNW
ncbi:MAG: hypothetical protein H7235_08145 [Bdellovibrionaceae bacterium]|nr:hypothetical protein [Pseudobdellovibrionaceae bacterium]